MSVTTFQLTSAVGGAALPFTVGLGFKKGDIVDTPTLDLTGSRVIVKTRWNDNSVKMAIASGEATLTANVPLTVIVNSGTAQGGTALTAADIQTANPSAEVTLGSYGTVTLSSLLATPFRTWLSSQEVVEAHYRSAVGTDPALAVWFYVRLYKSGRIRIQIAVENGYVNITNAQKDYIPSASINGSSVFTNGGVSYPHYSNTRWIVEGWIGGDPQITPKHDVTYLLSTKLVPNYWKHAPSATVLNSLTQTYVPNGHGDLTITMGNTGYQPQIGLLPLWDALYAASTDARAYKSCLANSSSYNSYPIVWRDPNTFLIPKPTDWASYTLATGDIWAGSLQWENAHAPSEGYLAYLITGDYWHYETMQMNSALNYLARNTNAGLGTSRLLLSQTRGNAWNLRTLSQAVAIAPDDDLVAADYKTLLANNVQQWKTTADSFVGNSIGYVYDYEVANNAYGVGVAAPWQHHFWIQTMGMGSDLEPLASMTVFNAVRDYLYKGVVGILGDANGYYFTNAYAYNIKISDLTSWEPADYYTTWKAVFDASVAASLISGGTTGNTLLGGGGGLPSAAATGYWGNLLPAIAYAVEHGAVGASAAWSRLTGATNWNEIETSGFDDTPTWGIYPRQITTLYTNGPSMRFDSSWIPGAMLFGNGGLGVLGQDIPSTGANGAGFMYLSKTANLEELRAFITTYPSAGTFIPAEDSSFTFEAPDGTYVLVFDLYSNGELLVPAVTVTFQVGATTISITDSAVGSEVVGLYVTIALTEVGSGEDTSPVSANYSVTDISNGSDTVTNVNATLTVSENISGTEVLSSRATFTISDIASGSDLATIASLMLVQVADSGIMLDTIGVVVVSTPTNTIVFTLEARPTSFTLYPKGDLK